MKDKPYWSEGDTTARSMRTRSVAAAVAEWRAQLINVDATNRLLYYRDLKVGTLDLADVSLQKLERLRAGQAIRLGKLFDDPVRLASAQRSLRQIAAKARAAEEEYGVPISFLASGMATWDDGRATSTPIRRAKESAIEGDAVPARRVAVPAAPVLLQPVGIEARPGTPDGFELSTLGDVFVNPVLVHVLASQFGVNVDESELLEAAGDDRAIFASLTKTCGSDVPNFSIADRILIGTFSYLKQPMVEDLDDDEIEFLASNDIIAALAGVPEARDAIRAVGGEVSEADPDYVQPVNEFLVLDADASQSYVINAASVGQNLVVQGPPGTGKSQTIANLIAELVTRGRSVLFVAQKRAAITAVLHRLELVGLGQLALDMFEGGGSRKAIIARIAEALESKSNARSAQVDALHARWLLARNLLTAHQAPLHERRAPWNVTVWELIGIERGLDDDTVTDQRLSSVTLSSWTESTLAEMSTAAAELAAAGGNDSRLLERSGWGIDAFKTLDELTVAHQLAEQIQSTTLPRAVTSITALTKACGLPSADDLAAAQAAITLASDTVDGLEAGCASLLASDVSDDRVRALYGATGSRAWRKTQSVSMGWRERRTEKKAARTLIGGGVSVDKAHEVIGQALQLRDAWRAAGAERVRADPAPGLEESKQAVDQLERAMAALQPRVQGHQLSQIAFADLDRTLSELITDPRRVSLPRIHQLRDKLKSAGLGEVLEELNQDDPSPDDAQGRIRYVFTMSVLDHVLNTDERLAGITRAQLERWAGEFRTTDQQHLQANADRVRRIAAVAMAKALDDFDDQHAEIKRQVRRKRGFAPVRRLFESTADVLLAIKPCWAMSPLMVSQVLPAQQLFDVVIFDEASQVMPADAIPAIARGGQVVVAGDRHQLPPTDFFSKLSVQGGTDDFEDDGDEESDEELTASAPETRDVESILDSLDVVLAGRSRTLSWHYRSKDEKLIATSNAYVYHHQLITFPGAFGADRLHFEPVEFSTGIGRNNKSPSAEVNRVVELALEHARSRPEESLGIIAFGSDHANRIEAALNDRLRDAPELQPFFQQSGNEPFFIKNIERVQGDERESIILTVGYGKGSDGRMRYMWGPLLGAGGERRLNVAISRARSRMSLVTSFVPEDIDPTANNSAGFQLMYRFLEFMASGGQSFGADPGRDVEMNAFEEDVFHKLSAAGLKLEPQWGVGHYRIDFAVRHPEQAGRFVLAVECDGAMYHSGVVARERDRLRQEHLESLGWKFHRIWSTDWWYDPAPQVEGILASYSAALDGQLDGHAGKTPSKLSVVKEAQPEVKNRSGLRPRVVRGAPITEYSHGELISLIRWIKSDDVVRTRDELLEVAMLELGYRRRGQRIVEALEAAIAVA